MSIVRQLKDEGQAAANLLATLSEIVAEDEAFASDIVEGETGLFEAMDMALERLQEIETLTAAIAARISDLAERKSRLTNQSEMIKAAIYSAMQHAELKKAERPLGTISRRAVPPKLVVTSEADIPAEFWKRADPTIDKRALLARLKEDGAMIPGAELSNGGETISIRSK